MLILLKKFEPWNQKLYADHKGFDILHYYYCRLKNLMQILSLYIFLTILKKNFNRRNNFQLKSKYFLEQTISEKVLIFYIFYS